MQKEKNISIQEWLPFEYILDARNYKIKNWRIYKNNKSKFH